MLRACSILVLSLVGCPSGPASTEPEVDRGPAIDLETPGCIAWSARTQRFACIALVATPTPEGVQDLTSPSMANTLESVLRTDAEIELGIVDVGPDPDESYSSWIAKLDLDLSGAAAKRQLEGLQILLGARGFDVPLIETLVLEPEDDDGGSSGAHSKIVGADFIYRCDLHEGDASFEYSGTLLVRCGADSVPRVVMQDLGGPFARIAIAEGAKWAVISIEHQDGGEGYVDVQWYHQAFALDELCSQASTPN